MKKLICLLLVALLLAGCTAPTVSETLPPETADTTPVVMDPTDASTEAPTEEATEETEKPAETLAPEITNALTVHFIDNGQGDGFLLECDGEFMVIDASYPEYGPNMVSYMKEQGVQTVKHMVATHPHGDHIGGLPTILDAFPVENIWAGPITYYNDYVNTFLSAASRQNLTINYPQPGDTFTLGSANITVLGPVKSHYEDTNDLSLVLMIQYGSTRFLFTGDMEQIAENDMLDYWGEDYDFSADVLKVGHHGSYSSTHYRLLRAVMPKAAVISCGGNNDYGHPHTEPVSRLQDAGATIYRTDKMYNIVAISDGETVTFYWQNKFAKPWTPEDK